MTKVHKQAIRFAKNDYDIILVGHAGHEEVEGTQGEAPEHIQVVNGPHEVGAVTVRDPEKVVWISQTTLSVDETLETVRLLRERFPHLADPPGEDICYATQNRQGAVKSIAPLVDVMVVVGSGNSSNSVRLKEVALEAGAPAAYRVDYARELEESWFAGARTVGLTSGASVPEILVREVIERLGEMGFGEVELVPGGGEGGIDDGAAVHHQVQPQPDPAGAPLLPDLLQIRGQGVEPGGHDRQGLPHAGGDLDHGRRAALKQAPGEPDLVLPGRVTGELPEDGVEGRAHNQPPRQKYTAH